MKHRIRLLCTSDLHGTLFPYSYADKKPQNRGLARLKTLIDSLRDDNTILIENGDTIEGSPLTIYHYMHHRDEPCPLSTAMQRIGYDYINVGNHDFNEGQDALFTHLKETGATCITHNFIYQGAPAGPQYVIREAAGKKVALFGLTTQYIPHWESETNLRGVRFTDAYETAKETLEILNSLPDPERPDYVVCVYHGGFERDPETGEATQADTGENEGYRMLCELRGIDVLLTGHQHRTYCGKMFDTVYTQPGANGEYLAMVDIDTRTGEITPELIPVDTEPDEEILAIGRAEEEACQKWLDKVIGRTKIDLRIYDEDEARFNKSQMITFLNKVQMETTGADISGAAVFLGASGFGEEITMRDLVSTYIFPNTLTVKEITGAVLRSYLEKCAEFWTVRDGAICVNPRYDFPTPGHYNYDMLDGVEYTIKASNPEGARIVSLKRDGEEIRDDDIFSLVVNNYRAAGGGDFDMIREAPTVTEYQTGMVEVIANYLQKHPVIDFEPVNNVKVI